MYILDKKSNRVSRANLDVSELTC